MKKAFLLAFVFVVPLVAHAALININTADAATLDTLPGIGPSKAAAIIDYRNLQGPFLKIEDIMNVSGIGPATFANIQSLITVGDSTATTPPEDISTTTPAATSSPPTATTSALTASSGGGTPQYIPIPTLRLLTSIPSTIIAGADTNFSVTVFDNVGHARGDAFVRWSFGDGMERTGTNVLHQYYEPGEYLIVVDASISDGGQISQEFAVSASALSAVITAVSPRGIALTNKLTRPLDLSMWRLRASGREFQLPAHTLLLAGHTVLFASQVTELSTTNQAELLYPNGEVATQFGVQPVAAAISYKKVQTVPKVTSQLPDHGTDAVLAPTTANTLAAVGAPLAPLFSASSSDAASGHMWAYGLLGILVVSGGAALILL